MDSETEALIRLREVVRRGPYRSERLEPSVPQIKMIVSDWYTDELGNQARIIQEMGRPKSPPINLLLAEVAASVGDVLLTHEGVAAANVGVTAARRVPKTWPV